jgi:glutathione synthase
MNDAAKIAMNNAIVDGNNWVLKPQREGGGNNMYGEAVGEYLSANRNTSVLSAYVLMRRIFPVVQKSAFLRGGNLQILPSVSEYGTYGVFLGDGSGAPIVNEYAGYLVRTKPSGI